ncbi:MAG: ABC transporter permease [Desulfamplus sp.]|nr:ABC transporter permease [Desulfamplus sp.]
MMNNLMMIMNLKKSGIMKFKISNEIKLSLPSLLWLLVFFMIPTVIVVLISFKNPDPFGGIGVGWSINGFSDIMNSYFAVILWRTVKLSLLTTIICLLLAMPVAIYMAKADAKIQNLLLLLIVIPFWTNFLIRIYAWKTVLHPEGFLKKIFFTFGLVPENGSLLYNEGAVLLVLVYAYLPFAILPLYTAIEKFDFRLIEAARDLGSGAVRSFVKIFLPGISQGIISAVMVVFIPALGSYVIPDMVGGPDGEMLGNKIAQRVFVDRNLPKGSALSTLLILAVILPGLIRIFIKKSNLTEAIARHKRPKVMQ